MTVRRHVTVLVLTVVVVLGTFLATLASDKRPVLGLDLQGGISIVLFPVEGSDISALDTAADIIRNRVDALGIAEPEISRQGNTIVVDLPGVSEREQAEALVGQTAELRFRLAQGFVPATGVPETTTTTAVLDESPTTTTGDATADATTTTAAADGDARGATLATAPIAAVRPAQEDPPAPDATDPGTDATPEDPAGDDPALDDPVADDTGTTVPEPQPGTTCDELIAPREENLPEATVWLAAPDDDGDGRPDGCYLVGPALMTGRNIRTASAQYDPTSSNPWIVEVEFRTDEFVTKVAQPYVGQAVAIELDGVVVSAPVINPGITGRTVVITGTFTEGEARDLALVLRYGSLPVQFDPDEQTVQSVSPTLGRDQLRAGVIAGLIGLALVALYMIAYYRMLGLVVWLGLALTAMIFFTVVSYLSANHGLTLTLAGVTGLIVSVGVTVDSYVVYFERLKDEVRSGKTVRSSLDSGFRQSWRTILAADFVSLLGATVLYLLATGGVRGFAFFLGLSTIIDLVLSYFFMHPLVSLIARRPALVRLRGVGIASGLDVQGVRA